MARKSNQRHWIHVFEPHTRRSMQRASEPFIRQLPKKALGEVDRAEYIIRLTLLSCFGGRCPNKSAVQIWQPKEPQ